jgi:hypothetical protein
MLSPFWPSLSHRIKKARPRLNEPSPRRVRIGRVDVHGWQATRKPALSGTEFRPPLMPGQVPYGVTGTDGVGIQLLTTPMFTIEWHYPLI